MLKYFLSAIFLLLLWAVVIILRLPEWIGIVATVVIVGGLIALYVYRRFQARRAAREIEKSLSAQAEEHAKSVRPDLQDEIRAMQLEFQKAIQSLKSSKLGRKKGTDALGALPWYMIIGPPGTGKSTALRNSGLNFPFLSAKGGGVKGIGGTRNCEWWLTNEAVILDTAGRYTTEEDDRDEWFAFLDMLKRNRPKRPANGVIVAVSVDELGGAHEEEIIALAKNIRERVDEVMARLRMVVPVYLLFTKCDLIPGFVETYSDLRKQDRGQIWGMTMRLHSEVAPPKELFLEHFDELAGIVDKRALVRLGQERRVEVRQKIYEFPQQFGVLRQNLSEFIGALFEDNVYQDTPIMRGVYFTSGTQEGRPIDRVMNAMAQAFGIHAGATQAEPVVEAKSYFLREVFASVIFRDQNVAVRSADEVRRQRFQTYGAAAGIFAFAMLVSCLPGYGYARNRELVSQARGVVELLAEHKAKPTAGAIAPEKLEALRKLVEVLREYETKGAPGMMRLGMYKGDVLYPHVRDFYTQTLRSFLFEPILAKDSVEMAEFGLRFQASESVPTADEHSKFYDTLKTHLLLTTPKSKTEPASLGEAEQTWLTEQLVERWRAQLESPADAALMAPKVKVYLSLLAADPSLFFPRQKDAVLGARVALRRQQLSDMVLDQLVIDVAREDYDLTLARMIGSTMPQMRSEKRVRGAFTRRGWENRVRQRLSTALDSEDSWVMDPGGAAKDEQARRDAQQAKLRSKYFAMYIQEWMSFLDSIRMSSPANNSEALVMLQDLTRGAPPPYGRLMERVYYNTHIEEEQTAIGKVGAESKDLTDKVREKLGVSPVGKKAMALLRGAPPAERLLEAGDVERTFRRFVQFGYAPPPPPPDPADKGAPPPPAQALPLDIYQEQLVFVRDALQTFTETKESAPLEARLETARTRVRSLIEGQEIGFRPRFEALLWPPIAGTTKSSTKAVVGEKGRRWCSEVVVPFERKLAPRYPFTRVGHDAALQDVTEYFRPTKGVVWAFYAAELASRVPRIGEHFQFAPNVTGFKDALKIFLDKSQDITAVLFPGGAVDPQVEFEVRIRATPNVASIQLDVDGKSIEYHNGPQEWHTLSWPGPKGAKHGATFTIRGANGGRQYITQEGDWGLFRLLEQGTIKDNPASRSFSVSWALQDQGVEIGIDVRPTRSENPFFGVPGHGPRRLMQPFRDKGIKVPRDIGGGHEGCEVSGGQ